MAGIPPKKKSPYNQVLPGVFGELGAISGTQVFFVQTVIRPSDLNKTTLIGDITGSESWPVRDLFQRDVDVRRVTKSLLPYLQDPSKIKFFNPLTLTILPMDTSTNEVLLEIPKIESKNFDEDDREWSALELEGFYRFRHTTDSPEFGRLEWNDTKAKLVAIDGQHRLSALKRFLDDTKSGPAREDFLTWSIPVVIVSFRSETGQSHSRSILEVVRNIFIYINTKARELNEARQILLTDESVNAICTQELIQVSHENDLKAPKDRDESVIPLLFFDWRGEEVEGQSRPAPASVKSIKEIHDWFANYLLGEDLGMEQEAALDIQPIEPLKAAFQNKRLTAQLAEELRGVVGERLIPGVTHLLQNFAPYQEYISRLRALEREFNEESDVARHAFHQLRFGANRAGEHLQKAVADVYEELIEKITHEVPKGVLHPPISLDVGMRGVMSSFGELREYISESKEKSVSWEEHAKWFALGLNQAYADGWIDTRDKAKKRSLLLHIVEDHNGTVVNYRLDAACDALGAYISLLVAAYGRQRDRGSEEAWIDLHESVMDRLAATLLRGYKKEVRPALREQYPEGGKSLTEAVKKEAEARANKHIKRLDKAIAKIAS